VGWKGSDPREQFVKSNQLRVLFLCTGNSARSQIAEALLRKLSAGRVETFSAGSRPQPTVHPMAIAVLREKYGLHGDDLRPKSMNRFLGDQFDYVITVCDRAAESCPVFPGDPERIHWSCEDPAAVTEPESQRRAFEHVATGIAARLRIWMSLPTIRERIDNAAAAG
jgi:protein-tyrosine-phosphatase